MRIGDAAQQAGVSPRSLRFYEEQGLIRPGRHSNGYRDYCPGTVDRAESVRALLESGIPVRLIKMIFDASSDDGASWTDGGPLPAEVLIAVRDHRRAITERIAALDERRSALDRFLDEVERLS